MRSPGLVRLRPRADTVYVSSGRTVLATGTDGFLDGGADEGLFVHETRLLSRYRYRIEGAPLHPVSLSHITQRSWLGYYVAPAEKPDPKDPPSINAIAQQTVELRLRRTVGEGLHEDVDLTNFTQTEVTFRLVLELEGDFADQRETREKRRQFGHQTTSWRDGTDVWEWKSDYIARHRYSHQGETGEAEIQRSIAVRFSHADSPPQWSDGRIAFDVTLKPHAIWHCCVDHVPIIEGHELRPRCRCRLASTGPDEYSRRTGSFLNKATRFSSANCDTLAPVVVGALERGKHDLAALRLFDLDRDNNAWTLAAGLPLYIALFGRDTLTAAWEAAPVSIDLMRGTLPVLADLQGMRRDDWRDEAPGRMMHEAHTGPLPALNYTPQARDYGELTSSAFYPFVVAQLWHWSADKALVRRFVDPALAGLRWLDDQCKRDGLYAYQTHSEKGIRNQGWKDSGDALVYDDGTQVPTPIAPCEAQGIVYAAKMNIAEVLWWLNRKEEAKLLYRDAEELKKRFNEAYWMEEEGFFAMALDPEGYQVRSIGSNPLHCIATGVADDSLVGRTLERLFKPDMFTGWGVRTLSSLHPAYNPYAYHRGAVWPVEHGPFAVGAYRYGYHRYVERIARAQFETAALFDFYRLPECIAGHPRDDEHPFPAVYPAANSPQAWSATTPYTLLQAILGMQPFAPLRMLFVDPFLPEWLPEITITNMRVADAVTSIRFFRKENGDSDYEILETRGKLHTVRQPSPWSFTASLGERAEDALASIFR